MGRGCLTFFCARRDAGHCTLFAGAVERARLKRRVSSLLAVSLRCCRGGSGATAGESKKMAAVPPGTRCQLQRPSALAGCCAPRQPQCPLAAVPPARGETAEHLGGEGRGRGDLLPRCCRWSGPPSPPHYAARHGVVPWRWDRAGAPSWRQDIFSDDAVGRTLVESQIVASSGVLSGASMSLASSWSLRRSKSSAK